MSGFLFLFELLVFSFVIVTAIVSIVKASRTKTASSDGHSVKKKEDLTCRRFGHHHPDDNPLNKEFGPQYIVHNEPETGYVILNGVKRKLTDCRDL